MVVGLETISIEARLDRLVRQASVLQRIREEQQALVPGKVAASEAARRLTTADRINEACQRAQLELFGAPNSARWAQELTAIRALAEEVLRENPVLLAQEPLHVIRSHEMPERNVVNHAGRKELRKGFGLHRHMRNDQGPSVVVAFTPPGYEQMWHAHPVDEYTLAMDVRFSAHYASQKVYALTVGDGELLHFHPHTYHTLANREARTGRTLTLKFPVGMSVWLPALRLTGAERGAAEVWSPSAAVEARDVRIRRFEVRDGYHTFDLNIAHLQPGGRFNLRDDKDIYVYVLDGGAEVRHGPHARIASADDLIVVEPPQTLYVRALTAGTRLYWASNVTVPPSQAVVWCRGPQAACVPSRECREVRERIAPGIESPPALGSVA